MTEESAEPTVKKPVGCTHPESERTYGKIHGADGPPAMLFVRSWHCTCGEKGEEVVTSNLESS